MRPARSLAVALFFGSALLASPAAVPNRETASRDIESHTFSIVAYDPAAKQWGCAVASKVLAVGAIVPWAKANGLPVGLMLTGRQFDDATVLAVAHAFEQQVDWEKR